MVMVRKSIYRYWDKDEFIKAVKSATTIIEVLRHFGCPRGEGHYHRLFHETVKDLGLDISHLTGSHKRDWLKIPLAELLTVGTYRSTNSFKKRLIKEGVLINKCYECGLDAHWNGKQLSLQLDHINGDNTDNRIENLRILCPNCHSQTKTFSRSKSQAKRNIVCPKCGSKKYHTSKTCVSCRDYGKQTKIKWLSVDEVQSMVNELGFSATGRKLGVSDNAVRKFLKRSGVQWENQTPV